MRKSEAGAVLLSPLGVREALMRRHVWLGGVTLVAAMALSNCTDKVGIQVSERFTADLKGTNERPTQVTTTATGDRKSTRLNSSHDQISYAVFCLKKKKNTNVLVDLQNTTNATTPATAPHTI